MRRTLVVVVVMACSKTADRPPVMGSGSGGTSAVTAAPDEAAVLDAPESAPNAVAAARSERPSGTDDSTPDVSEEDRRMVEDIMALPDRDVGGHPGADLGAALARQEGSPRPDAEPIGRILILNKRAIDVSSLEVEVVATKIQDAYVAGLKRCYREVLARDAVARGKLTLHLRVEASGRTGEVVARSFDPGHERCVSARARTWRFPIPRDGQGEPTPAAFMLTILHAPD